MTLVVRSQIQVSTSIRTLLRTQINQHQIRNYSAPGEGIIPSAKQKYVPTSGTYPKGFTASSTHVGVKPSNTRFDDLTVIASDFPCSAAAVFTKNKFQAAPVTVSRDMLKARNGSGIRSVVVNSGCANAVTGRGGVEDAQKMGAETDRCLPDADGDGEGLRSVVMSTGVIGQRLPISKIITNIPVSISKLGDSHDHWLSAARAICTTDTFPKLVSSEFSLPSFPNVSFRLAGMTKGAGMIHPNMATLLGILCTDAPVSPEALQSLLTNAVDRSFNCISIDGDTSTNDTVAILANGAAAPRRATRLSAAPVLIPNDPQNEDYAALQTQLTSITAQLAQLIIRDGEGATKFVEIRVRGAPSRRAGHRVASSIARSPLVKTALYGKDANWGRILCAIGYTENLDIDGVIEPTKVSVSFVAPKARSSEASGELRLLVNGEPQDVDEARAARVLEEEDLEILVKLDGEQEGKEGEVNFWTCDFSHEYVTINGDYRT